METKFYSTTNTEKESLPFVPQLPDCLLPSPMPMPLRVTPLAPRIPAKKSVAAKAEGFLEKNSSSRNKLSLMGMVSLEMAQQCTGTNNTTQWPALKKQEPDQIPQRSQWRQANSFDLSMAIGKSRSFPEPTILADTAFASPPGPSFLRDSLSPNGPSGSQPSRREFTLSPAATPSPQGDSSESYRLLRRDESSGESLRGRHCLLFPEL